MEWLNRTTDNNPEGGDNGSRDGQMVESRWRGVVKGWYDEGQAKVGRVGRRYGLWQDDDGVTETGTVGSKAGEGVANAVAAYVVVKVSPGHRSASCKKDIDEQALLPVRIGVSLGASPVFARWALEPIRNLGTRWIRRKGSV